MGRQRKADPSGHMSKAEKERRAEAVIGDGELVAPAFLCPEAKKEFERVKKAYEKTRPLDSLDLSVLAVYADAWAQYSRLAEIVSQHGPVIVKRRVTGKTEIFSNPAVAASAEYVHRIMQCSLKLGLAVTDRLKLAIPKEDDEDDAFSEFEGGV